jgi:YD repeat-containing protein
MMAYDGYGRLSSRHVPEQNVGTATTWTYNADDTAQAITDARGAVTTFTYNARHLPTGMTHTLGAEVLTQAFAYDAAGNRTSMSDTSGATSYHFTALSQIDSETRTFNGLGGSYTLTYEYTLAGQLKNLTDHTNQRVNYSYDAIGRLNNIVGANYNSNQFITNIKARAWGSSGEIIYGNGLKATFNYNNRLQTEHFQLATSGGTNRLSLDYEYHDDGRIRYSQNLLDAPLDRSFEYDHVGRLTKALSGAEARGEPATTNRPYKETATYDEFDHLKVRSSLHWSRTLGFGSSDTYVNNRRVNWTYDADGNWLSGGQRQHVYDAAGRTKTITWSTGDQFTQSFDAVGRRVKTVESNITTYFLRSTVLGGQVIEELNASGAKEKGFIYAHEKLIAYQAANGNVILLHEDPGGLTVRTSTPQSNLTGYWAERDPWGAEVYTWDPYLADPQFSGGRGEGGPVFPGFGDISMPSHGCTQLLDGVLSLCDFASRNMNGGGILVERHKHNGTRELLPIDVYLGVTMVWHPGHSGNSSLDIDYDVDGDPVIRTNNTIAGYWEIIAFIFGPQKRPLYSDEQVAKAVDHCARVYARVSLRSFDSSRKSHNGTFRGTDWDATPENSEITIVNEVNAYSAEKLGEIFANDHPGMNAPILGLTVPLNDRHGNPTGFSPYRNFTANNIEAHLKGDPDDRSKGPSVRQSTQIWELGNSLSKIKPKTNRFSYKREPGAEFEDCVRALIGGLR